MMSFGNRRLSPRLIDCDYLHLVTLRKAICLYAEQFQGQLIDYGAGSKPYRELFVKAHSYQGADFAIDGPGDILLSRDGMIPCDDACFDALLSFQVIEHVPNPSQFLSESFRVIRPGGSLLLTTHGTWPYHPGPDNDDFYRWTAAGLCKDMQNQGFVNVLIDSVCGGVLCLLQQMLVLKDPARKHRRGIAKTIHCTFNLAVNLIGMCLYSLFPDLCQRGDILPICYLVRAKRPQ
jgi:SAM-dependent methyltransferase